MESVENQNEATLLKLEEVAPEVYKSLHELKRTGWVEKNVENPESVKEHTESLIRLLMSYQSYFLKKKRMV